LVQQGEKKLEAQLRANEQLKNEFGANRHYRQQDRDKLGREKAEN
jgi:hypothetical protein